MTFVWTKITAMDWVTILWEWISLSCWSVLLETNSKLASLPFKSSKHSGNEIDNVFLSYSFSKTLATSLIIVVLVSTPVSGLQQKIIAKFSDTTNPFSFVLTCAFFFSLMFSSSSTLLAASTAAFSRLAMYSVLYSSLSIKTLRSMVSSLLSYFFINALTIRTFNACVEASCLD